MNTLQEVIEFGKNACLEHGFDFIEIYRTRSEKDVNDGWDRYIVSLAHPNKNRYIFVGFVRNDGTFVGIRKAEG